jgi:hypothetical protein
MLNEPARLHRRPLYCLGAPLRTGALFLILTAYFDESGTHAGSPATILSGIMGTANQWAHFQTEMNKIKARYSFTVFHAKEFRAQSGEFRGWSPYKCRALLQEMMAASSKLMDAITITLTNDVYEQSYREGEQHRRLRLDTKYALCLRYALLNFVVQALKKLGNHRKFGETRLNVVMESGHKNAGDAERVFHEMRQEYADLGLHLLDGITFKDNGVGVQKLPASSCHGEAILPFLRRPWHATFATEARRGIATPTSFLFRRGRREGARSRGSMIGRPTPDTEPDIIGRSPPSCTNRNWMGHPNPERWSVITRERSPLRESRTVGSVRGAASNRCPYRDSTKTPIRDTHNVDRPSQFLLSLTTARPFKSGESVDHLTAVEDELNMIALGFAPGQAPLGAVAGRGGETFSALSSARSK